MSEITEGLAVVDDLWDVLKALVTHSSLADEIKTAAHKVIDDDKADTIANIARPVEMVPATPEVAPAPAGPPPREGM
jgi:hypothetical protein